MRRAAAWSLLLHVMVILVIIIGLPYIPRTIPDEAPIPMEIVTVADKTTQKDKPPEPPQPVKQQEKPPEPQQAQPQPQPTPAPPPPPPPVPQQQAETKPTPQPEKAPEPKAEPLPQPKPEPTPKAPEQVAQPQQQKFADAKPQKKPQPTKDDFLNNVLKDVAPPKVAQNDAPKQPVKNPSAPPPQQKAAAIDDQLTMSEIDFIRRQYIECWNPPAGARDAENLVVLINVDYNPDGSVRRAVIADSPRMGDAFYRTAAESALRAVLNPRCNPLKAPLAKYDLWKSVTLSFNPKDLFGT